MGPSEGSDAESSSDTEDRSRPLGEPDMGGDMELTIIGCGSSGGTVVSSLFESPNRNSRLVAVDTDIAHLKKHVSADEKLLLRTENAIKDDRPTDVSYGREAAHESLAYIEAFVDNQEIVVVTAGLGGATGTGAAPVIAESATKHGAITVAIVSLPYSAEGNRRQEIAESGLRKLRQFADTTIVVRSDCILDYEPEIELREAYRLCDSVLAKTILTITGIVAPSNLVQADLQNFKNLIEHGGISKIGFGQGHGEDKYDIAVSTALNSPLLDIDLGDAVDLLIYVTGDSEMTAADAKRVVDEFTRRLDPVGEVYWSASVNSDLRDTIESRLIVTDLPLEDCFVTEDTGAGSEDIDYIS